MLIERAIGLAAHDVTVERLVDVGCGDSPYRGSIDHSLYVGVDRSPAKHDGDVVIGDAASLPLLDGSADAVLCTEVIEHVPDERRLAAELARIARPGAVLVLSAPFVHGLHEVPYDYRRLTSIGLVTVLDEAGWAIEEVWAIGGAVVVAVDGIARWGNRLLRQLVRQVAPNGSAAHRRLISPSAAFQLAAARATILASSHLGPIDPMSPSPRLTLGYAVRAVRRDGA